MKKLILLTVLQVCFLAVKAQNNISFSISQQMKNSTLWITSTITNNDPRELAILDGSMIDNEGEPGEGGHSYIKFKSYLSDGTLVKESDPVYLGKLGGGMQARILLKKGESYKLTYSLFNYSAWLGIFSTPTTNTLSSLDATLYLVYFWIGSPYQLLTTNFTSNKLAL